MSSAFPKRRFGRLLAAFRERDFPRACYRGCSYFFMFRPHSLHASQIAPTAASKLAGQPRLLHPSRTCVVTFARIGYTIRPTTGNWRNEDFHLARSAALSAAHSSSKLFRTRCAVCSPPPKGLPDSIVPIRQHGVQGQVLAITPYFTSLAVKSCLIICTKRETAHPALAWDRSRFKPTVYNSPLYTRRPRCAFIARSP